MIVRGALALGIFFVLYTVAGFALYARGILRLYRYLQFRNLPVEDYENLAPILSYAAVVMVRWHFRRRGRADGALIWDHHTVRALVELYLSWPFWLPAYEKALHRAARRHADKRDDRRRSLSEP